MLHLKITRGLRRIVSLMREAKKKIITHKAPNLTPMLF